MKNVYLTIITLLGVSLVSFSQEKSVAKVHYIFKHVNDTTQRDNFLRDEVVTYLGTSKSYYTSYSPTRMSQQVSDQTSSPTFDGNLVIKGGNSSAIKESYLLDTEKSKLNNVKKVGLIDFNITEQFPQQDWTIEEDTKQIGGYTCQKATTTFKGRNYEAWFCADIPMSFGPWKLHGLPGLILEAKDDKNEVIFEYAGFDKTEGNESKVIAISPEAKPSTEEEILKLEAAFNENRSAFLQSQQSSRTGGTISIGNSGGGTSGSVSTVFKSSGGTNGMDPSKIKSVSVQKDPSYKPSAVTNNPIELAK